jgi:hypothetical protein
VLFARFFSGRANKRHVFVCRPRDIQCVHPSRERHADDLCGPGKSLLRVADAGLGRAQSLELMFDLSAGRKRDLLNAHAAQQTDGAAQPLIAVAGALSPLLLPPDFRVPTRKMCLPWRAHGKNSALCVKGTGAYCVV